jgi:hypothetical protein
VTAQARISQADMDRAVKAAAKAERARVVMDLRNQRIEIIIGESNAPEPDGEVWSDDDV